MQSVASTLNIEIYFLNKSGREKRVTVANWLKCKGSPENNLLIFCQRKTDEYCPSTQLLSPPVVWITSYQVPMCYLPWRELEPSQRICSCLWVSVCGHTVVGRGVSGDVSERLSLNYAGNLKVLSHCCFEAEWIKKKHSENFWLALHEQKKKEEQYVKILKQIHQNTMGKGM